MNRTSFQDYAKDGRMTGNGSKGLWRMMGSIFQGRLLPCFSLKMNSRCWGRSDRYTWFLSPVVLVVFLFLLGSGYSGWAMNSISKGDLILDGIRGDSTSILIGILVKNKEVCMAKVQDKKQMLLPFEYKERVKELMRQHDEIGRDLNNVVDQGPESACGENEEELCNEVAAALKADLRESGMSRDELLDKVNAFLGRTEEGYKKEACKKPMTLNMLNNYMSKPSEYPLPSHFQYAFNKIFGSFRIQNTIVGAMKAQVISGEDIRRLTLMKIRELKDSVAVMEKMI